MLSTIHDTAIHVYTTTEIYVLKNTKYSRLTKIGEGKTTTVTVKNIYTGGIDSRQIGH
jgi:hypothetical protein